MTKQWSELRNQNFFYTRADKEKLEQKCANLQEALAHTRRELAKAKEQIGSEKAKMVEEVRSQVADMVVVALNKILSAGLSKDIDKKYITKALKDFK